MNSLPSLQPSGKRPAKQIRNRLELKGSKVSWAADTTCNRFKRSMEPVEFVGIGAMPRPEASDSPPQPASRCFPSASPTLPRRPGKQKAAPKDRLKPLIFLRKSGAGEGIRTLDPNLGKVVLYP